MAQSGESLIGITYEFLNGSTNAASIPSLVTNIEVLENAKITNIKSQLCRTGHVSKMGNHCLPRIILYGELSVGYCDRGAPKKQFKDCLKKSFGACDTDHCWLSTQIENCDAWHLTTNHIVSSENTHRAALKVKRYEKRNYNTMPSTPD